MIVVQFDNNRVGQGIHRERFEDYSKTTWIPGELVLNHVVGIEKQQFAGVEIQSD